METRRARDLTLVNLDSKKTMVIACDSCGAVGMKEGDVLKVPSYYVGRFTARVALMEVLCTGAEVITVTDTVSCEMEPTGREIINGIEEELKSAGIAEIALTGSTEENFQTSSTGLGVTVIGVADTSRLKVNNINTECSIVVVGIPKVGNEIVLDSDPDIVNYEQIDKLLKDNEVHEIVPAGSKGILYEAKVLAESNGFKLNLKENIQTDIYKTCGPATVVIAAVSKKQVQHIHEGFRNVEVIGELKCLKK
jgi:hypothetical protein